MMGQLEPFALFESTEKNYRFSNRKITQEEHTFFSARGRYINIVECSHFLFLLFRYKLSFAKCCQWLQYPLLGQWIAFINSVFSRERRAKPWQISKYNLLRWDCLSFSYNIVPSHTHLIFVNSTIMYSVAQVRVPKQFLIPCVLVTKILPISKCYVL